MKNKEYTNAYPIIGLAVVFLAITLLPACLPPEETPPTTTPAVNEPAGEFPAPTIPVKAAKIPSPASDPVGLAWDGSHLWVVDGETKLAHQVDPATGESVKQLELAIERPDGAAWDGTNLWVLDAGSSRILRLDPETGEETGSTQIAKPDLESEWSYAGLTWDGRYLWVAINAGWCSKIKCIDPTSGEVVREFFPQCNPRGLASDGTHLWTIAYNGKESPSKVSQRLISEKGEEIGQSHEFILDLQVSEPTDLAYGDSMLWVADRAEGQILQIQIR